MRHARHAFAALAAAAVIAVILSGCAALGVESPQGFNDKVLVALATVATVRDTAATLLVAQKITVKDAENVQAQADNAREAIALARQLEAARPGDGAAKLDAATNILRVLQAYLQTKRG